MREKIGLRKVALFNVRLHLLVVLEASQGTYLTEWL